MTEVKGKEAQLAQAHTKIDQLQGDDGRAQDPDTPTDGSKPGARLPGKKDNMTRLRHILFIALVGVMAMAPALAARADDNTVFGDGAGDST